MSAQAGLVEVNTSQYIRESGSPSAQTSEVTLENEGEIRISNINLQDADFELSGATQIYLNGSAVLSPFQVPYGGYAVFPLTAGTHYLEVTLRGKPGGGLEVAFYENKPDAPTPGKGFQLLDDGTVLHKKTGLIWHRFPNSPGLPDSLRDQNYPASKWSEEQLDAYFIHLNMGDYGIDPDNGNAGHTDWRLPTPDELFSLVDLRFGDGCQFLYDEEARKCFEYYRLSDLSGDLAFNTFGNPWFLDEGWEDRGKLFNVCRRYLTSTLNRKQVLDGGTWAWSPWAVNFTNDNLWSLGPNSSCVWPVRGGQPD